MSMRQSTQQNQFDGSIDASACNYHYCKNIIISSYWWVYWWPIIRPVINGLLLLLSFSGSIYDPTFSYYFLLLLLSSTSIVLLWLLFVSSYGWLYYYYYYYCSAPLLWSNYFYFPHTESYLNIIWCLKTNSKKTMIEAVRRCYYDCRTNLVKTQNTG